MPNSYQEVNFSFQDGHKRYRWLLASPSERILATLVDVLFTALAAVPLLWLVRPHWQAHLAWDEVLTQASHLALFWAGVTFFLIYLLIQVILLAQCGQTLGKRILGIRIIHYSGKIANFVHTLLLRSVLFLLLCVIGIGGLLKLIHLDDNFAIYELLWIPYVVCFFMQFQIQNDYRTLQDRLANTVVVRAKMRQEA